MERRDIEELVREALVTHTSEQEVEVYQGGRLVEYAYGFARVPVVGDQVVVPKLGFRTFTVLRVQQSPGVHKARTGTVVIEISESPVVDARGY